VRTGDECFDRYAGRGQRDECWPWLGPLQGDFPSMCFGAERMSLSKWIMERFHGKDAVGRRVLRECRNRHCCNPDHFYLRGDKDPRVFRLWEWQEFQLFQNRGVQSGACREWTGKLSKSGYGVVVVDQTRLFAHRVAFCLEHEVTLAELGSWCILHACDNPKCILPSHLSFGDRVENNRQKMERGRASGSRKLQGAASCA
jgi:hypothetical protein